jgi:hypothetical protein
MQMVREFCRWSRVLPDQIALMATLHDHDEHAGPRIVLLRFGRDPRIITASVSLRASARQGCTMRLSGLLLASASHARPGPDSILAIQHWRSNFDLRDGMTSRRRHVDDSGDHYGAIRSASFAKLSTTRSFAGLGTGSGGPTGPHSSGRKTKPVRYPTPLAASRSKLWQATIKIFAGLELEQPSSAAPRGVPSE